MDDMLIPLAASMACVEAGLSAEESVALTAAALVIKGPLALAPVFVAIERQRAAKDAATSGGATVDTTVSGGPVTKDPKAPGKDGVPLPAA